MPVNLIDNEMVVVDENGKEHTCKVLFTYENEQRKKTYVFLGEPENEDNVLAFICDEKSGDLYEIEDDEEFKEVEEVFECYMNDPKMNEIK